MSINILQYIERQDGLSFGFMTNCPARAKMHSLGRNIRDGDFKILLM